MTTLRSLCGTLALCALLLAPRTLPAQAAESLRAAERAHAAGVTVRVELWQGQLPHVFQAFARLPQTRAAVERILCFIRLHAGWNT